MCQTQSFNGIVCIFSSSRTSKFYSNSVQSKLPLKPDLSKPPLTTDPLVKLMKGIRRHHVANLVIPMAYCVPICAIRNAVNARQSFIKCTPTRALLSSFPVQAWTQPAINRNQRKRRTMPMCLVPYTSTTSTSVLS